MPQVQKQSGKSDCGCFAVAWAVHLAYGDKPETIILDQTQLGSHLEACLLETLSIKFLFRRVLVQQSQHIGYRGNMSLSNYVTELYGQSTQVTTCQLQKTDSKMTRISNHLTFLTRCQKCGFTPKGLRLKAPVQSANTAKILK